MHYEEIRKIARRLRSNQTNGEKVLWEYLRKRRLNGFRFLRQHPVFYDRTMQDQRFFVIDFYCPKCRTAIELDGKIHDFQKKKDRWREEIIKNRGIRIIRIKNEELSNMELVFRKLEEVFGDPHAQANPPPTPP